LPRSAKDYTVSFTLDRILEKNLTDRYIQRAKEEAAEKKKEKGSDGAKVSSPEYICCFPI